MNTTKKIHIAVLLNGEIINDSRIIKVINTLSSMPDVLIDLFYVDGTEKDKTLFTPNVNLYSVNMKITWKIKLLRHTLFYNEFLFFVREVLGKKINYDYIYANDLPCLKPAIILKSKLGSKVIYDSHEIYTETINQFFPRERNIFKKMIFELLIFFMKFIGVRAEKRYIKKVDYFITVCEGLKSYFEKKYKITHIKILMNVPFKQQNIIPVNIRKLLNFKEEDFLLLYQGTFNRGRGLYQIIDALKYTDPHIKLVFLGTGHLELSLKNYVKKNNLNDKIFFLEKVDSKILLQYTKAFDCGINMLEPINLSNKFAAPNKLFEYMHAEIPVIASFSFETDIIFAKYTLGIQTTLDVKSISQAMNKMAGVDTKNFKENCKKASFEYNWENQELILKNIIN